MKSSALSGAAGPASVRADMFARELQRGFVRLRPENGFVETSPKLGVYRARDTRLNRGVAIKALHDLFAN